MQKVFQLENGQVTISNGNGNEYTDTQANFIKDYPSLTLTNKFIIYNPSLEVYVLDGEMTPYAAQSNFDACINAVNTIIGAQQKRNS